MIVKWSKKVFHRDFRNMFFIKIQYIIIIIISIIVINKVLPEYIWETFNLVKETIKNQQKGLSGTSLPIILLIFTTGAIQ